MEKMEGCRAVRMTRTCGRGETGVGDEWHLPALVLRPVQLRHA